jgi:integrase
LDAIVGLALHLGLRRAEIWRADIHDLSYYNAGVVVRDRSGSLDNAREVPFTTVAWEAMRDWLVCRSYLAGNHGRSWLTLHAGTTMHEPMTGDTFDKHLATYAAPGYTLKRLRDTCAVAWVRSDLPLEHLRQLLGLSIEGTLPYARLARVPRRQDGEAGYDLYGFR